MPKSPDQFLESKGDEERKTPPSVQDVLDVMGMTEEDFHERAHVHPGIPETGMWKNTHFGEEKDWTDPMLWATVRSVLKDEIDKLDNAISNYREEPGLSATAREGRVQWQEKRKAQLERMREMLERIKPQKKEGTAEK